MERQCWRRSIDLIRPQVRPSIAFSGLYDFRFATFETPNVRRRCEENTKHICCCPHFREHLPFHPVSDFDLRSKVFSQHLSDQHINTYVETHLWKRTYARSTQSHFYHKFQVGSFQALGFLSVMDLAEDLISVQFLPIRNQGRLASQHRMIPIPEIAL